ncbi:ABC transporter, ATP-binding protein [Bifidobacterium animalis subsp. animalis]|nr:ABC transporter, ATP-binding protein [Bifidobacterium animalis subsp. animalis]
MTASSGMRASNISYILPSGRSLLNSISFAALPGECMGVIGANGVGKSTLLKIMARRIKSTSGSVNTFGDISYMEQRRTSPETLTIGDYLFSAAPVNISRLYKRIKSMEAKLDSMDTVQMQAYSQLLADYADLGGYQMEADMSKSTQDVLGSSYQDVADLELDFLSGGEQKMLHLNYLFSNSASNLILDEPDNFLDIANKERLKTYLKESAKTILLISHDRDLLEVTCKKHLVMEQRDDGTTAWVHGGRYSTVADARADRHEREEELLRRRDEEERKLRHLVSSLRQAATISDVMASRYHAAQTRLDKFLENAPARHRYVENIPVLRFEGGRSGDVVLQCSQFGFTGLIDPFDFNLHYKDRVAILGANGTGKSHFLKYIAYSHEHGPATDFEGWPITGGLRLGASVRPGWFSQFDDIPGVGEGTLLEILMSHGENGPALSMEKAMPLLDRYRLIQVASHRYGSISGGQRARFQLLLLELRQCNLLLLDEPTDNLDVESAEALESLIQDFQGTVMAVTHDRWFAKKFTSFLVFHADHTVQQTDSFDWDNNHLIQRKA